MQVKEIMSNKRDTKAVSSDARTGIGPLRALSCKVPLTSSVIDVKDSRIPVQPEICVLGRFYETIV